MTGFDLTPSMAESSLNEVFEEVRYVSAQNDTRFKDSKKRSRDPYNLGEGKWYHLAVANNLAEYGLQPSAHIDGVWHTTFVRLRPEVEEVLKPRILWPASGFCVIRHPVTRKPWLTATGDRMIGECTVCYLTKAADSVKEDLPLTA